MHSSHRSHRSQMDSSSTDDDDRSPPAGPWDEHEYYSHDSANQYDSEHQHKPLNEKMPSDVNIPKAHSVQNIIHRTSRRRERIRYIESEKGLNMKKTDSGLLRPRHRSKTNLEYSNHSQEQSSTLHSRVSLMESDSRGNFNEDRDQKNEEHDPLKTNRAILIHVNKWKQYISQLQTWRRISFQRAHSTFTVPPIPSKQLVFTIPSILSYFCGRYLSQCWESKTGISIKRSLHIVFLAILCSLAASLLAGFIVVHGFLSDAAKICRPPGTIPLYSKQYVASPPHFSSNSDMAFQQEYQDQPRPLVEYYVHGRGNGHYSRSIAIIQRLNKEGIDVRMFIGRASMWREINDATTRSSKMHETGPGSNNTRALEEFLPFEAALARRVAKKILFHDNDQEDEILRNKNLDEPKSTVQYESIFDNLPWENEFALHYHYPQSFSPLNLNQQHEPQKRGTTTAISVVSLIPKLTLKSAVSHAIERITGDCEVSQQTSRYPVLVISDGDLPGMMRAKIGKIPSISISHGTTFTISKADWKDNDRDWRGAWSRQGYLNKATGYFSDWLIGTNFIPLEVTSENAVIARPPIRKEVVDAGKIRRLRQQRYLDAKNSGEEMVWSMKKNKLVICYFRDKNGVHVVEILKELGFDVVVFNPNGAEPGMEIGKRWKLTSDEKERAKENLWPSLDSKKSNSNDERELSLPTKEVEHLTNDAAIQNSTNKDMMGDNKPLNFPPQSEQRKGEQESTILVEMLSTMSNEPRSIQIFDKKLFVTFMGIADGIVGSGGSQVLSESVHAHIPMLALFKDGDDEQMLNIEMLRRRRDEDLEAINKENTNAKKNEVNWAKDKQKHTSKLDPPPKLFGTSLQNLLSTFPRRILPSDLSKVSRKLDSIGIHDSYNIDNHHRVIEPIFPQSEEARRRLEQDSALARQELDGFVDAVRNSVISQSYYNEIFQFLSSPHDKQKAEKMKNPTDAADIVPPNKWLDAMPDAAEVVIEIINQLF